MNQSPGMIQDFYIKACCFEASLILVAYALGWFAEIDPFATLFYSEAALLLGIIGTLPMVLLFRLAEQRQEASFQKIRQLLLETLGPGLDRRHWTDLLVLAMIAGISEEALFRGVLQPWLESVWGMQMALIACNILFGLAHAVTPLYAILAFMIGIYLSMSMDYGGVRNLLTPLVIHSLYDFWAFLMLVKAYRANQARTGSIRES